MKLVGSSVPVDESHSLLEPLLRDKSKVLYCILLYIYKWKNHFYEMKGDVGMSLHEKERNKKMPT